MLLRIPAKRLIGQPLVFTSFLGSDLVAEIDGLRAGWILASDINEGRPFWWWTMTGPSCGEARIINTGRTLQLDEAKAAFRTAFGKWMDWASNQSRPIVWFDGSSAAVVKQAKQVDIAST